MKNQNKLKYSWIMGCYNKQAWVAEAIDSILTQTDPNFELIIVDDASQDNSNDVLEYYEKKDNRVRVFHNTMNQGVAYTYNRATEEVKSDIILVAAADDVYTAQRGQWSVEYLKKWEREDIIYFPFYKAHYNLENFEIRLADDFDAERLKLPQGQFIGHGFMAYRTAVGRTVPYRKDLRVGCDHAFMLDCWKAGFKFRPVKDETQLAGTYRFYSDMVSIKHREDIVKQDEALRDEYKDIKATV